MEKKPSKLTSVSVQERMRSQETLEAHLQSGHLVGFAEIGLEADGDVLPGQVLLLLELEQQLLFLVQLDGARVRGCSLSLPLAVLGELFVVHTLHGVQLPQPDRIGGDGDWVVAVGRGAGGLRAWVVVSAEVRAGAFVGGCWRHGEGEGRILFVSDPEGVFGKQEILDVRAERAGTAFRTWVVDQVGWDGEKLQSVVAPVGSGMGCQNQCVTTVPVMG